MIDGRSVQRVHLKSQFRQGTTNSRYSQAELASAVAIVNDDLMNAGTPVRLVAEYLDNGSQMVIGVELR